jgi:hypothetical protein
VTVVANRWAGITIDCHDPARLASFWSALLGTPISDEHEDPDWATVGSRRGPQPRLTFQHEFCLVQYYE